jgi:hypothetical protein
MSAETTLTAATTHRHYPCILSCGYKSIYIPKSGLEFPAWLVCFETTDDEPPANNDEHAEETSDDVATVAQRRSCKRARQKSKQCYFWRSKRDFWRLGRATAASSLSSSSCSSTKSSSEQEAIARALPKAAWKKLSNEAPWKRPDYNEYYDATDTHNEEQEDAEAVKNGWKRHMCKSLRLVDQYLQQVAQSMGRSHDCSNCDIHRDCSNYNLNSSDNLQEQQCKACTVKAAWNEFCRPCDADDLIDKTTTTTADINSRVSMQSVSPAAIPGAATAAAAAAITTAISTTAMTGNALGQYFCHPANAQQLVNVCLERVQQQLLLYKSRHGGGEKTTQFLFVEPSCGHGQVLEALLDELDRRQSSSTRESTPHRHLPQLDLKQCSFVGIDIDPTAIAHCRDRFSQRYHDYHCRDDDNDIQPDITWMTIDFLQSQRSSVMKNRLQVDGTRSGGTPENENMVIVMGGPPYSAGAGHGGGQSSGTSKNDDKDKNGSDGMQRDLPMRFVKHAVQEWGASIVTFLMPERCGRKGDTAMQPNDVSSSSKDGCCALANIQLESPSVFYFQGLASAPVKQPSIIQCFWREGQHETIHANLASDPS